MNYIIGKSFQAITLADSNYYRSKVYVGKEIYYLEEHPLTIIRNSCEHYGNSIYAWEQLVKRILNQSSKLPIPIHPLAGIFLVPTNSYRNKDCIWLNYYMVSHHLEKDGRRFIVLQDGQTIPTTISSNQFTLQMQRTSSVIAYFYKIYCMQEQEIRQEWLGHPSLYF